MNDHLAIPASVSCPPFDSLVRSLAEQIVHVRIPSPSILNPRFLLLMNCLRRFIRDIQYLYRWSWLICSMHTSTECYLCSVKIYKKAYLGRNQMEVKCQLI